ncbi:lipopolysaccharide biosynthesis protein [Erythrobacter sp. YT30]|uniref:lipopolysaccharide biosynthesis protein n=1 Tax=Erythrobacter sp. YT30 TaxID=1735012 RepID=UPI00076D6D8E|nr:lipopolysaccharide biosynthesis protein [Erythrobacter sp. YT30]KWV90748.1 polysaccharide biosynthesis protein [Erythrobacter sp. YT30]
MTDQVQQAPSPKGENDADMATLAKGGRQNTAGFVVRLLARIPFLIIAARYYGEDALGRFASAFILIEIIGLVCSLGEKRGLAHRLRTGGHDDPQTETNLVYDGLLLGLLYSLAAVAILLVVPDIMFPNGMNSPLDMWMVAAIPAFALTEIVLAAQAYRYDIATTVRARAIVEPWAISIAVGVFLYFDETRDAGLGLAYIVSVFAGLLTALWPFLRTYGLPKNWRPNGKAMLRQSSGAFPLVGADAVERGTRLLDIFILGLFAPPAAVGIYYVAQQIASLPQKLKTSFEPILSPVITKNLKTGNMAAIASQVRQVGFWIIAIQFGIALALGIPGEGVMGLWGPAYVAGTAALAFLLAAEVAASMAVVSESVLVYIARKRNLAISVGILALQAALTVTFILIAKSYNVDAGFEAAMPAAALFCALATSSLVKALVLKRLLKEPVSNWRWALVYAAAPAVVVGYAFTFLPEWVELAIGIPAILAVYCFVIWKRGFGEEDKVLFRPGSKPTESPQT